MEIIDTLTLARQLTKAGKLPVDNHRQTTLAAYYGIEYQAHSAIEDVKALIQVYEKNGLKQNKKSRERITWLLRGGTMELNLMNMSSLELEILEQDTQAKLDLKLRNMMYDDHMDELFEKNGRNPCRKT